MGKAGLPHDYLSRQAAKRNVGESVTRNAKVQTVIDLVHRIERLLGDYKVAVKQLDLLIANGKGKRGAPRKEWGFTVLQYRAALRRGGSRRKAAKILGIPHASLDKWCERNKVKP